MEFNSLWVFFSLFAKILFVGIWAQEGEKDCFYGFIWNKTTQNCDQCPPGSTGPACTYKCIYPAYGESCSRHCKCDAKFCDVLFGCTVPDQTGIHRSETISTPLTTEYRTHTISHARRFIGTTETGLANGIGTSSVSLVSYTAVVLIGVFVVLLLVYIVSYSSTFISFIRGVTPSLSLCENDSSRMR